VPTGSWNTAGKSALVESGSTKKERRNPNDSSRFIGKRAVTDEGEAAKVHYYLDEDKIAEEERYDGLYAVSTDLLDDPVKDIEKLSKGHKFHQFFRRNIVKHFMLLLFSLLILYLF